MSKVVLITGTRKGIGNHLARHYLALGHFVAGCSRKEKSIEHENYRHWELDVSDEIKVAGMVREASREFGGIDVLINNAGMASMNHLTLTPLSVVRTLMDTNYAGSFLFLREASKVMLRKKKGRIVNFSTVAVPLSLEGEAVYASSKAAIETLTKVAARELGGFGITVNAIGPTPVPTDLIKVVPKNKIDELVARQAIKRHGSFDDVTNVIDFFIDDRSDFITGQIIYLGGIGR